MALKFKNGKVKDNAKAADAETVKAERPEPEVSIELLEYTPDQIEDMVELATKKFGKFAEELKRLREIAKGFKVEDDAAEKEALEMIGKVKKFLKAGESERKVIIGPSKMFFDSINRFWKPYKDIGADIERILKRGLGQYMAKKELERKEREKKEAEAAAALQAKLDAEAEEKGLEKVEVKIVKEKKDKKEVVRSSSGTAAHTRKNWTFEVLDFSKVPDQYKVLDRVKVNSAIKAGIREIPGLEIKQEIGVSVRA